MSVIRVLLIAVLFIVLLWFQHDDIRKQRDAFEALANEAIAEAQKANKLTQSVIEQRDKTAAACSLIAGLLGVHLDLRYETNGGCKAVITVYTNGVPKKVWL